MELRDEGWRFPDEPAAATVRRWIAIVAITEVGYDGVGEEFDNDLRTRDYIEELCGRLPGFWSDYFQAQVAPWDDRFRAATIENPRLYASDKAKSWWHHRFPRIWPGRLDIEER